MITTTRRSYEFASAYEQGSSAASVDLLERPQAHAEYNNAAVTDDLSEAKERRKNLDKLLNYDRYSEQLEATPEVAQSAAPTAPAPASFSDEDIRPTSTTMQFGEDIDSIRQEMRTAKDEDKTGYRLNGKGKVVVVLYSLVVTVILALIVLNTGLLANLSGVKAAKAEELTQVMQEYDALTAEIDNISGSDYISSVAENEYGMVKGN